MAKIAATGVWSAIFARAQVSPIFTSGWAGRLLAFAIDAMASGAHRRHARNPQTRGARHPAHFGPGYPFTGSVPTVHYLTVRDIC